MARIDEVLEASRRRLERLPAAEAYTAVQAGDARLVDVRTAENRTRDGRLPGALEISLNVLEWRLDPGSEFRHADAPTLDALVIVVCEQGYSSSLAAARLQDLGFTRATDLIGGFEAWREAGLPIDASDAHGRS